MSAAKGLDIAGCVHALVRAVRIVVRRAARREILLRLCYLLRGQELPDGFAACSAGHAQRLRHGLEIENFRANQNVRLFHLTQRIIAQSHSAHRIQI